MSDNTVPILRQAQHEDLTLSSSKGEARKPAKALVQVAGQRLSYILGDDRHVTVCLVADGQGGPGPGLAKGGNLLRGEGKA